VGVDVWVDCADVDGVGVDEVGVADCVVGVGVVPDVREIPVQNCPFLSHSESKF